MMKRFYSIIYIILGVSTLLIASVGCSRRVQLTDEELAQVFHDAFLANAYTNNKSISLDSLRLYEPIFQKYGYTSEDVQYTIGSFATRKSARLSDVVERAIAMLESRGLELDRELEILNSLDEMAKRETTEVIFSDSVRAYRSLRDSSEMKIVIDSPPQGAYNISFRYLIDSLDKSEKIYRSQSWTERDNIVDEKRTTVSKAGMSSTNMRRDEVVAFQRTLNNDREMDRLVINLVVSEDEDPKVARSIKIKDIEVTYTATVEQAREILFQRLVGINIFDDELLFEK